MRKLEHSYGRETHMEWSLNHAKDLRPTRTSPKIAAKYTWKVSSFQQLLESVAFVSSMNKHLILFYRGQTHEMDPIPTIFRPNWTCFATDRKFTISPDNRKQYWKTLKKVGHRICDMCDREQIRVPRLRGLKNTREIQWAIIQHYGLWPTPLIDVTSSLHVATAFLRESKVATRKKKRNAYLYIVGMPHSVGSITFNGDEHITIARLQSVCPPVAKRPHFQEGFLIGHFPLFDVSEKMKKQSSLLRRLVVKFQLQINDQFWGSEFPQFKESSLMPENDPLYDRFLDEFGPESHRFSLLKRAEELQKQA